MPDQYRSGDKFRDISAIDSRLAELEQEKQQLVALKAELHKTKPVPPISDSFTRTREQYSLILETIAQSPFINKLLFFLSLFNGVIGGD